MNTVQKTGWSLNFWSGLVAWMLGQALVILGAVKSGRSPFDLAVYSQWDSGHYLSIAEHGPVISQCVDVTNRASDQWCGSAGWLPIYPALIAVLSKLSSLSLTSSAFIISAGCALVASVLASRVVSITSGADTSTVFIIACNAAIFPGMVWGFVSFPISMTLMFFWTALLLDLKGWWHLSSVIIGLTAVTHSVGLIIVGVWLLVVFCRTDKRTWLWRSLLTLCPSVCFFGYQEAVLGHWNAHLLVQSAYGHQPGFLPFIVVRRCIEAINNDSTPLTIVGIQQFWLLAIVGIAGVHFLRRRKEMTLTLLLPVVVGFACVAFAMSIAHGSDFAYWRAIAFGSLIAPLFGMLPRHYLFGMTCINAVFFFAIANGYIRGFYF